MGKVQRHWHCFCLVRCAGRREQCMAAHLLQRVRACDGEGDGPLERDQSTLRRYICTCQSSLQRLQLQEKSSRIHRYGTALITMQVVTNDGCVAVLTAALSFLSLVFALSEATTAR